MKSGNLNFLEPSGPLQACNGTDLHLTNTVLPILFKFRTNFTLSYDNPSVPNYGYTGTKVPAK